MSDEAFCPECGHKQKKTSLQYVELAKQGYSNTEIAQRMGVSQQAVSRVLRSRGIRRRTRRPPEWLHLAETHTAQQIADEVGIKVNSVRRSLARNGLKARPAPRGPRPGYWRNAHAQGESTTGNGR